MNPSLTDSTHLSRHDKLHIYEVGVRSMNEACASPTIQAIFCDSCSLPDLVFGEASPAIRSPVSMPEDQQAFGPRAQTLMFPV